MWLAVGSGRPPQEAVGTAAGRRAHVLSTEDGHHAALTDTGQVGTSTQGQVDARLCFSKTSQKPRFLCVMLYKCPQLISFFPPDGAYGSPVFDLS